MVVHREKHLQTSLFLPLCALCLRVEGFFSKAIIFGPAEQLTLTNVDLQQALHAYMALDNNVLACKFIADKASVSEGLAGLGLNIDYVGAPIADLIKQGYAPMLW